VFGTSDASPRDRRRTQTRDELVDAAWEQGRRGGLSSLSLRELAAAVGLRAPSLYSYFDSKHAIYDAMFRQAHEELAGIMAEFRAEQPVSRERFAAGTRRWFEFCVSDPTRYQLLYQRVIPGFEPSPESYALAVRELDELVAALSSIGIDDPAHVDLYTGLTSGLVAQQLANDPGGDRWQRLLDGAIGMYLDHVGALTDTTTSSEGIPS
jgi:AcrR family transcriptional regulator